MNATSPHRLGPGRSTEAGTATRSTVAGKKTTPPHGSEHASGCDSSHHQQLGGNRDNHELSSDCRSHCDPDRHRRLGRGRPQRPDRRLGDNRDNHPHRHCLPLPGRRMDDRRQHRSALMSHSSQAGLASIRRTPKIHWADQPTLVVNLSSAAFELKLSTDGHWYVINGQPGSPTAQGMIGLGFEPGRNPWEWESGYAARIQHALNKHFAEPGQVTEAFGVPITPQKPIIARE